MTVDDSPAAADDDSPAAADDDSPAAADDSPDAAGQLDGVAVDPATADDRLDILRILDAAMLSTDADTVDERIAAGDAFVARSNRTDGVVGALVATRPDPARLHVDAVAVRRARRGRGIGSALVAAAVRRGESEPDVDRVTASFDAELTEFYEGVGFAVDDADEGRRVGRRRA